MAAFPRVTIFFLVSTAFAAPKPDFSRWPPPPCEMYIPPEMDYDPESECPNITAPVCTQDRRTYQNECFFCVAQWDFGDHIKFDKYGKCD